MGCLLGAIIYHQKIFIDEIKKNHAHSTNDNDFLHAELMMISSRTDPKLIREMKKSANYKQMVKQYNENKQYIEQNGERP